MNHLATLSTDGGFAANSSFTAFANIPPTNAATAAIGIKINQNAKNPIRSAGDVLMGGTATIISRKSQTE